MRVNNSTRYAAIAALIGGLACAGNKARTNDTSPNEAAAARDTTSSDTTQNPPGYRGMERDTTMMPRTGQTASDTFLQKQGQGSPQDTAGYSGIERDTTHHAVGADTSGSPGYHWCIRPGYHRGEQLQGYFRDGIGRQLEFKSIQPQRSGLHGDVADRRHHGV